MKKLIPIIICFLYFISYTGIAQEMNLDEILAKYHQTIGTDKVKEWKTLIMTGKSSAQGMEFPLTFYTKRPGKIRAEILIQGNKMLQIFDGQAGWSVIPWSGSSDPQDMTPDDIKEMKEQADLEGTLYNWKEKGHKVELIGKEDLEGTPVYKLKVTLADGNIETYFIDAENFVTIKISNVSKIQGNETESEAYMSNYKDVSGALMPFAIENKVKGQTVSNVVIDKYEINQELNDSLFIKPVKKQ
jgi:outer membrane lipoprotein-sorting protein